MLILDGIIEVTKQPQTGAAKKQIPIFPSLDSISDRYRPIPDTISFLLRGALP
jgi:hypothetical protein